MGGKKYTLKNKTTDGLLTRKKRSYILKFWNAAPQLHVGPHVWDFEIQVVVLSHTLRLSNSTCDWGVSCQLRVPDTEDCAEER